jgi:rhodanese-related sulfurtransferase
MANKPEWLIERSAAIPIFNDNGVIKVVLVTTKPKTNNNWIFPKGQIELGMSAFESAAKEAFEEAGVIGHTSPTLFGTYQQNKWGSRMQVRVYTMEVTEILDTWDEMRDRDRVILPLDEAINLVQSSQKHILIKLKEQLAPQVQQIEPSDLNEKMKTEKNLVLLDVREQNERPVSGILSHNEIHIPLNFVKNQAYSKIKDRNTNIVVYCGKGIRGLSAAQTLKQMGYSNVSNLKGGVKEWKNAGLKTLISH